MARIAPCLWFDSQAEDAAAFYVEAFRAAGQPAAMGPLLRAGADARRPAGSVLTAGFTLAGQEFIALNGGAQFSFSPAISLAVTVADQAGLDALWDRLSARPEAERCGWLTDRFGLSWQVVPEALVPMLSDADPARAGRVMQALMGMGRLDLAALERAYAGP